VRLSAAGGRRHPARFGRSARRLPKAPRKIRGGIDGDLLESRLVIGRLLASCGAPFASARASYRQLVMRSIFDRPLQRLRK